MFDCRTKRDWQRIFHFGHCKKVFSIAHSLVWFPYYRNYHWKILLTTQATTPGLLEGKAKPDTARCVDIATRAALRKMIGPGTLAILSPVIIGFLLGPKALGGMLGGALICCVMMALMMSNAGGAWDNAKKFVEKGNFGGKGSDVHKAAVVGDTVGDPLKDTSGPSMNILINVMAIVSLVIAPLLIWSLMNKAT